MHHRYFINSIVNEGILLAGCLFEQKMVKASFPTGPVFEREEASFEDKNFFKKVQKELQIGEVIWVESVNTEEAKKK